MQYAAIHEPDGTKEVTGDVLVLPDPHAGEILESLDRYEGIGTGMPGPAAFKRQLIPVLLSGGEILECWAWLFALSVIGLPEVRSGDCLMQAPLRQPGEEFTNGRGKTREHQAGTQSSQRLQDESPLMEARMRQD